jgi:hypothetical protein
MPRPVEKGKAAEADRAIAPYVEKARATYPEAKKRYLAGLPPKHTFFITTRLHDDAGKWEQVFIAVESIKDGQVTGRIASEIMMIKGFKQGGRHTFPETDMLDWLISLPDGSEEGNFVGKFLDTYQPGKNKTVRELLQAPEFRIYSVIFGITIDADGKLQGFKVSGVTEPKVNATKTVDAQIPQAFLNAAREKVIAKKYEPKLENGKPVEFFTYFYYSPQFPNTVITDLDQPPDAQP